MKKLIGSLAFALTGWKLKNDLDISKIHSCVLVCAPHTSNWDFFYAVMAFWKLGIPMKLFIKDSWTKPWYGFVIKWLGGIGVDRSKRNNLTDYAGELLKNSPEGLFLINSPEATRSFSPRWKKGFYYIAQKGGVPIVLAFCDYKKKEAGIGKIIDPATHSVEETLKIAEDFYRDVAPKFPENFNPKFTADEY
ncbi:1-acyl-sn-glycerol-3-phosphate acyltransferase [Ornithobacterium rhinotracheale]|uniref:1-acyl-sn-glycerol-3-phosphate acyltransferase n=1 Tax=Ornithobacterium rhinotracheale TaxID=28251 RepID=UPI004035FB2F